MEAVHLTGTGSRARKVTRSLAITESIALSYLADCREAGIEGLCRFNPYPP